MAPLVPCLRHSPSRDRLTDYTSGLDLEFSDDGDTPRVPFAERSCGACGRSIGHSVTCFMAYDIVYCSQPCRIRAITDHRSQEKASTTKSAAPSKLTRMAGTTPPHAPPSAPTSRVASEAHAALLAAEAEFALPPSWARPAEPPTLPPPRPPPEGYSPVKPRRSRLVRLKRADAAGTASVPQPEPTAPTSTVLPQGEEAEGDTKESEGTKTASTTAEAGYARTLLAMRDLHEKYVVGLAHATRMGKRLSKQMPHPLLQRVRRLSARSRAFLSALCAAAAAPCEPVPKLSSTTAGTGAGAVLQRLQQRQPLTLICTPQLVLSRLVGTSASHTKNKDTRASSMDM